MQHGVDGQVAHLPAGGVAEFLGLGDCPFQGDAHIPQGHQAGVRIFVFRPVRGQLSGRQLKHGEAQHIRGAVNVSGGAVDFPDARIIRDQDVDLALGRHALGLQHGIDARADVGGNNQALQAALLEYQIDLISHWFSSFDTVPAWSGAGYFQALQPFRRH